VLPLIGVLFSLWVLAESLYSGAVTPTVLAYGLGSIGVGAVLAVFLHRGFAVPFFEGTFDSLMKLSQSKALGQERQAVRTCLQDHSRRRQ